MGFQQGVHTSEGVAGHRPLKSWGLASNEWQLGNRRAEQREVAVGVAVEEEGEAEGEAVVVEVTVPHWMWSVSGDQRGQISGQGCL